MPVPMLNACGILSWLWWTNPLPLSHNKDHMSDGTLHVLCIRTVLFLSDALKGDIMKKINQLLRLGPKYLSHKRHRP